MDWGLLLVFFVIRWHWPLGDSVLLPSAVAVDIGVYDGRGVEVGRGNLTAFYQPLKTKSPHFLIDEGQEGLFFEAGTKATIPGCAA